MAYERIIRAVMASPWAILPEKMDEIMAFLELQAAGHKLDPAVLRAQFPEAAARANPRAAGNVAVLPLYGVIAQRMGLMSEFSGGTSTERFGAAFRQAVNDPNVKAIVIDTDSPGGSVGGVAELADEIYRARGSKPIVAVANSMAASAAYWIAASADEVVVTPGGVVGSVGVISAHTDISKAAEAQGVKTTFITAGRFKAEGNEWEPLGDEARAARQSIVDDYYGLFVNAVARGRGVAVGDVRGGFGEGRVVTAKRAVAAKMADRVGTLRDTLQRFGASLEPARAAAPEMEIAVVAAVAEEGAEIKPPARTAANQREIYERRMRLVGVTR